MTEKEAADLPTALRSGFPVEFSGVGGLHAAFLNESRARGHVPSSVAGNPGTPCRKTFPRKVRGTADPTASLGMTKERATFLWKVVSGPKAFFITLGGPQVHDSSVAQLAS
jgi:hypothetical protein